jgi:uncharacterized RDD family membrane protein YckC
MSMRHRRHAGAKVATGLVLTLFFLPVLFLLGAATVHDYRLRATLGTTLLSLAGIVVLWGVGVLVLTDPEGRRMGDKFAGTKVIDSES